jgi:hypothetical protein
VIDDEPVVVLTARPAARLFCFSEICRMRNLAGCGE